MSFRGVVATFATLIMVSLLLPGLAQADFGVSNLDARAVNGDGSTDLRAGSHPFEWTLNFEMNQDAEGTPEGTLRELAVDLPVGMIGNPQAVPLCPGAAFAGVVPHCSGSSQIGVARVKAQGVSQTVTVPVYNLTPPSGVPASVGFSILEENSFQEASLRPGDYGVAVSDITVPTDQKIQSVTETIWGVPAEAAHDPQRFCFNRAGEQAKGCASEVDPEAFLTLPTSCTGPLKTTVSVRSVQEPEGLVSATVESLGEGGAPEGLDGCDRPGFEPSVSARPETGAADSPTGLDFDLHIPQASLSKGGDPEGAATATANLKDAVVSLPAGLAVNPSTASGLSACSLAEMGYEGMREGRPTFSGAPSTCPSSSQIGTVEVETPLLDHPLPGAVYIGRQVENPFGSLIAIYIVIDDPVSGVRVKRPGDKIKNRKMP